MRPWDGPGSGPYWDGSRTRPGLVRGFLSNLCTAVTSCFYVFCCCWLIEDCCMGSRRLPGPPFGSSDMLPPPPPDIGPQPHGLLGSIIGGPPGPPPPPNVRHRHHGLLGSAFDSPPSQSGPFGYPSEPAPYG